jgi:hypothetical protein
MTDEQIIGPDGHEYSLAVPFVVTHRHGGPYDDQAFVAGFQAGQIFQAMAVGATVGARSAEWVVRSALGEQLDLIAMHLGYQSRTVPLDDAVGWSRFSVVRSPHSHDG